MTIAFVGRIGFIRGLVGFCPHPVRRDVPPRLAIRRILRARHGCDLVQRE